MNTIVAGTPMPPLELRARVGCPPDDGGTSFDIVGASCRREIISSLPPDWDWLGKRMLDFGCGVGRTLRHFSGEASLAEFWGCDIDARSIRWLEQNGDPSVRYFVNGSAPPLHLPTAFFDLICALSVFTHIDQEWADWLLELRRLLAPDGLLLATFLGPAMAEMVSGRAWDDSSTGMNVYGRGTRNPDVLPNVLHSPWWLRAHWGRAFEIVSLEETGFGEETGDASSPSHGWVVMRNRPGTINREDLEAPEPDEPRELTAALRGRAEAAAEARAARDAQFELSSELERLKQQRLPES